MSKENQEFFSDSIFVKNNKIWIISTGLNYLQEIDRESGEIVHCAFIPTQRDSLIPYRSLFEYKNKLYILPYCESRIMIYDLDKRSFSKLKMCDNVLDDSGDCYIYGYTIHEDIALMYTKQNIILVLFLNEQRMEYYDLNEYKHKIGINEEFEWIWNHSYYMNDSFVIVPSNYLCRIFFNVTKKEIKIEKLDFEDNKECYLDTPYINLKYHIFVHRSTNNSGVEISKIVYDENKDNRICLNCKVSKNERAFGYITSIDNKLIMLPGVVDKAYVVDLEDDTYMELDGIPTVDIDVLSDIEFPYELNYRNAFVTPDLHLIAIHGWTKKIVDFDMKTFRVFLTDISIKWTSDRYKMIQDSNRILDESSSTTLSNYIEIVRINDESEIDG